MQIDACFAVPAVRIGERPIKRVSLLVNLLAVSVEQFTQVTDVFDRDLLTVAREDVHIV